MANILKLEKLDLSATGLSDEGMANLLRQDSKRLVRLQLQELKVCFNAAMTDKSLSLLAAHVPCLKTLDIRHCDIKKTDSKETFRELKKNGTQITGGE